MIYAFQVFLKVILLPSPVPMVPGKWDYTCIVLEVDARRILSVQIRRTDAGQERQAEGDNGSLCGERELNEEASSPGYYSDGQWVAALGDETSS